MTAVIVTRTASKVSADRLIEAAERVLLHDGPTAVTIRAVATAAGVAPMGVYSRFGGKDGLLDRLIAHGFCRLRAAMTVPAHASPLDQLRTIAQRYRTFALNYPHYFQIMFVRGISRANAPPDPAEGVQAVFDEIVKCVALCMSSGELTVGCRCAIAQQIWSTLHGATHLEIAGMMRCADPAGAYQDLVRTLIRGLQRPVREIDGFTGTCERRCL